MLSQSAFGHVLSCQLTPNLFTCDDKFVNHFPKADYGGKQRKAILAVFKLIFQNFFFSKIHFTAHSFTFYKNLSESPKFTITETLKGKLHENEEQGLFYLKSNFCKKCWRCLKILVMTIVLDTLKFPKIQTVIFDSYLMLAITLQISRACCEEFSSMLG